MGGFGEKLHGTTLLQMPRAKQKIKELDYETENLFRKVFNWVFWFPFLSFVCWLPVCFGRWLFTRSGRTKGIKENVATYRAMELVYTYDGFTTEEGLMDGFFQWLWVGNIRNSKAARNRLKLVENLLKDSISDLMNEEQVKILSLGSGSARGVILVLSAFNNARKIVATLVDMSRNALTYSKELARRMNVADRVTTLRAHVLSLNGRISFQPDIVEVVGLADYLDDENFITLVNEIHQMLKPGGIMLVSNIETNPEIEFMEKIVEWKMIYRGRDRLANLIETGGFNITSVTIYEEPLHVHLIAVARKL